MPPKAIASKTALHAELERIVANGGVAVEDEEQSVCRCAIAAVVVDAEGRPVASVELAVPAEAYTREKLLNAFGPKVIATARGIGLEQAAAEASERLPVTQGTSDKSRGIDK